MVVVHSIVNYRQLLQTTHMIKPLQTKRLNSKRSCEKFCRVKAKNPRSIKLEEADEARLASFLKNHPSYSFPDVVGLAIALLLDRIDGGATIINRGSGLEIITVDSKNKPPLTPKQQTVVGQANRVSRSA